ncbi:hypothetical protein X943_000118 [Babesia divergens]|uniref:Protein SDA1 n=1 Tax=Babesia divergens TaxID=32595 RepID=A0AAD9GK44_BABDI|nr:hypothetical protein X943_000118 [Babesia divergens]
MEQLETLISQIRRDPEAHRDDFLRKWEEFCAAFAVLRLTPQLYKLDTMALLNFVAQAVPFYVPPQVDGIDVVGLAAVDSKEPCEKSEAQMMGTSSAMDEKSMANQNLGRQLCIMIIDFIKNHRKGMNGKMLKQLISTTFLLRSKRLVDIFTILPEWLALLDLDDRDVRRRLFVFIVRDLTIVFQHVKNIKITRAIQRLFFEHLNNKSVQVQLLTCCICVEMHKRRIWRDSHTVNSIAQCALASNLKIVLAGAHFLLGTKNHFDVAFEALEDVEDDIAALEDLKKQKQQMGTYAKKSGGRQNRIERSKKMIDKLLERRKRRIELCAVREFAAIDDLHDAQKFTERLFERCGKKDVTFGAKLILLQLVSLLIARHRLLVPNFYGFVLKYINHKQKLVTKILAITAQAVHAELPTDLVEPVIQQVMDQFVSEDRSNEVITVGMNTLREIASRAPFLFNKDTIAQLTEFRHIKNKAVSMATKSFINLYREEAPELLHPTIRGREAGTKLTNAKKGKISKSSQPFSSTYILSQEDFVRKKLNGTKEREAGDDLTDEEAESGTEDDDDISQESASDGIEEDELSEGEYEDDASNGDEISEDEHIVNGGGKRLGSHDDEEEDDEDSDETRLKVNPDDLTYGSKKKRVAAHSRREAALARMERKNQRLTAESRAGQKQSTTNRVKARNKPVLMTMQSRRIKGKQMQNVAEKMATLKRHLKSLKKGNVKYKKRRR